MKKNEFQKLLINTILYKEFNKYLFLFEDPSEIIEKEIEIIFDQYYIDILNKQIDILVARNIYSSNVIENIKKIIYIFKKHISYSKEEDNNNFIKQFDEMLKKLNSINTFSNDFIYYNYICKYSNLENMNKLVGVNFDELYNSMTYDYLVLHSIVEGKLDKEIDYKFYILSIKYFLCTYNEIFTISEILDNTFYILNQIKTSEDDKIQKDAQNLLNVLTKNKGEYFNLETYTDHYYYRLILGMIVNKNFNDLFDNLSEKEIMSQKFIINLMSLIRDHSNNLDERAVKNLKTIVGYISINYQKYYDKSVLPTINKMKMTLNSQSYNISNFNFKNLVLRENFTTIIKYIFYGNTSVISKKNCQKFWDLIEEMMDGQYSYSEVLKSYTVSKEEFDQKYLEQFIADDDYIKNIRQLFNMLPTIFMQDQAYDRTVQVFNEKLEQLKEREALTFSYKREHEKMLKKLKKYKNGD